MMLTVLYYAIGVLFLAGALLAGYRVIRGPSVLDRAIGSDVLLTTVILVVGSEMALNGHTRNIPLMLVLATTAIFATIAVARYVSNQDNDLDDSADPKQEAR